VTPVIQVGFITCSCRKKNLQSASVAVRRIRDPVFFFYPWIRNRESVEVSSGSRISDPTLELSNNFLGQK
jgi:hypothetical protein